MGIEMGRENSIIRRVAFMMVSGKTIICTAMENFTIPTID